MFILFKIKHDMLVMTSEKITVGDLMNSDNRNNLLMKLAGSTRGTSANTLRSSAVALCYNSAAEYCAPAWSRSAHTSQVDVQLNFTMRLISSLVPSVLLYTSPMASSALQH